MSESSESSQSSQSAIVEQTVIEQTESSQSSQSPTPKPRRPRITKQSVLKFREWMNTDDRYLLKPAVIQERYKNEENVDLLLNFIRTTKRSLIKENKTI